MSRRVGQYLPSDPTSPWKFLHAIPSLFLGQWTAAQKVENYSQTARCKKTLRLLDWTHPAYTQYFISEEAWCSPLERSGKYQPRLGWSSAIPQSRRYRPMERSPRRSLNVPLREAWWMRLGRIVWLMGAEAQVGPETELDSEPSRGHENGVDSTQHRSQAGGYWIPSRCSGVSSFRGTTGKIRIENPLDGTGIRIESGE